MPDIVVTTTGNNITVTPATQTINVSNDAATINVGTTNYSVSVSATPIEITVNDPSSIAISNTDQIPEGSSNLYFTNARARTSISVTDAGGLGSLTYNSTTGAITYTGPDPTDLQTPLTAGLGINITGPSNNQTISADLGDFTSDNLLEGSINQYFTQGRVRQSLAAGTGVTYDNVTGQISIGQSVATTASPTFNRIQISNNDTQTPRGIHGSTTETADDYWLVGGLDLTAGASSMGAMVIATGNNADGGAAAEPIYVQQYGGGNNTQPFPGTNTVARTLTLLDQFGNTQLPGSLTIGGNVIKDSNGVEFIRLTTDNNGTKFIEFGRGVNGNYPGAPWGIGLFAGGIGLGNDVTQISKKVTGAVAGSTYYLDGYSLQQHAAKYIIQINTGNKYQMWEGMVIHDGTNVFVNAYGDLKTSDNLATITAQIIGSSVYLIGVPTYANTTFRLLNVIFGA